MDVILTAHNLGEAKKRFTPEGFHPETTGTKQSAPPAAEKADQLITRVVKLVPGEVAAGYTAFIAVYSSARDATANYAALTAIVVFSVMIVMLIRRAGDDHKPPVKAHPTQYCISLLAFLAWAFSIGNPLDGFDRELPRWITGLGIIVLPIFGGLLLRDRPPKVK